MNNEKKNQVILVSVIGLLLISVIVASIFIGVEQKDNDESLSVIFDQLYNSDYDLHVLNEEYFFGTYGNKLNVFIDKNGNEVLKTDDLISYDGYYKNKAGNYVFYNNDNDILSIYVFDGKSFNLYYSFEDVKFVKPIVNNDVVIGFTSFIDDKLYFYSLDNEGFVSLSNVTLKCDKFRNNVYYINHSDNIVVSNSESLYGVVNISGNYIIEHKYQDVITLANGNFIIKENGKYGIIDKDQNVLVKCNYDGIIPYDDYYLFIKGEQMALYNSEFEALSKFNKMNYNKVIDFNYRDISSVKLYNIGDNLVIVNNYDDKMYEYKSHNMYIFKDDKYVDHEYQIGFEYTDKLIYSYDSEFNIKFYNIDMKVVNEFILDDVKEIIKVEYYNELTVSITYINDNDEKVTNLFDYNGKIVDKQDRVLLSNSMYYVIGKDNKLIIKDYYGNELSSVVGNLQEINKDYVIVDHILYRIIVE